LPPLLPDCILCNTQANSQAFLMTRKWSNLNLPGALHFVTANVLHRIPVFREPRCCQSFFEICADLFYKWPSKLIAFVLMPDHFHLIVNPRDGNVTGLIGALKSRAAETIIHITEDKRFVDKSSSVNQVWQESFKALPLWSEWMIWQKINYIHANPVRARLVGSAKDYPWSSFRAFYHISNEPLPVDHDWWWPDDSEKLTRAMKELSWGALQEPVQKK
jgi:REP-associated tyrosine transposase